jgi:hypothetical protein
VVWQVGAAGEGRADLGGPAGSCPEAAARGGLASVPASSSCMDPLLPCCARASHVLRLVGSWQPLAVPVCQHACKVCLVAAAAVLSKGFTCIAACWKPAAA